MKKTFFYIIAISASFTACKKDLDLEPFDKLSPSSAFNTEKDLQLYANSFYNILPTGNEIVRGDAMSDYLVGRTPSTYIYGTFNSTMATGWSWTNLRNVNYFLQNYEKAKVTTEALNHFAGLARFFRAWFYFDMVKQFGDLPWYNKPLDVNDPDLYKARDARTVIMDSVLADLDFACKNIRANKDLTSSQVTKWVALAFKSRVCLFEGTFRKYHTELGLTGTADKWLTEAVNAADELMNAKNYSLHNSTANTASYRDLFRLETPVNDETILSAVNNKSLRIFNDANWYWTSATYGGRYSLIKTFVNTYLNIDGSRFTEQAGFNEIPFDTEVKNRDLRLQQTIRMGNYARDGAIVPPDFTYTYSGYMPIKLTLDAKATDGVAENFNSLPIIRYAEVLLNYAEAKAELGTFETTDWDKTIKLLRARAGISNTAMPAAADPYLQQNYFPDITDAVLLEIRRERGIELVLEGFRYDDLKRWKTAKLLEMEYDGMYVPAMDITYDLNEDTKPDVAFVTKVPTNKVPGVYYFIVDGQQFKLSEGTKGRLILMNNLARKFEDYKYFYPIPYDEIVLNPALKQNPQWQ